MKIVITLALEIDPEAWHDTYGHGDTPRAVRDDVRSYVLNHVQQAAGITETGGTVEMRSNR